MPPEKSTLLLNISSCEPKRIQDVDRPGLVLPISTDGEAFLCVQEGEFITAILLNGEWAFHSEAAEQLDGRLGLLVPDVEVRVELGSMAADGNAAFGSVVKSPGVYGVRTRREIPGGGSRNVIVPLDGAKPEFAPNAVKVAFARWHIGKQIENEWMSLWSVDV